MRKGGGRRGGRNRLSARLDSARCLDALEAGEYGAQTTSSGYFASAVPIDNIISNCSKLSPANRRRIRPGSGGKAQKWFHRLRHVAREN